MASTSAPANDRLRTRITRALPSVTDNFAQAKLSYIASQITPAGMLKRGEDDQDVRHLHEVADSILKHYETTQEVDTDD